MSEQNDTKKEAKPTLDMTTRTKLLEVATLLTSDDRANLDTLVREAQQRATPGVEMWTITPAMAAMIFLHHNAHNRDWRAPYALSLHDEMKAGRWRFNNATIGFYRTGELQDGQHRLSASALANMGLMVPIVFGIEHEAIVTTDTGSRRTAGDAGSLEGITDAKRKRAIVKTAATYRVRAGDRAARLTTESEVLLKIRTDNDVLDAALQIGAIASDRNKIVSPILDQGQCETAAYLLLSHGWEVLKVEHYLAYLQLGMSKDGESTPLFVAGEIITEAKKARTTAGKLNRTRELGVIVYAIHLTEEGHKAVQKKTLISRVKKGTLPDPHFQVAHSEVA